MILQEIMDTEQFCKFPLHRRGWRLTATGTPAQRKLGKLTDLESFAGAASHPGAGRRRGRDRDRRILYGPF